MSSQQPEPRWQPLQGIPLITDIVQGMLKHTQDQHHLFQQCMVY